jgi:hypothetical protein
LKGVLLSRYKLGTVISVFMREQVDHIVSGECLLLRAQVVVKFLAHSKFLFEDLCEFIELDTHETYLFLR